MGVTEDQLSGFDFPMIAKGARGRLNYVQSDTVSLVKASLRQIVLTAPGERLWQPEFGCKVRLFQFDTLTETAKTTLASMIMESIRKWEPRVKVDSITVNASPDVDSSLEIRVGYTIKNPDFVAEKQNILIKV